MREIIRLLGPLSFAVHIESDPEGVTVRVGHGKTALTVGITAESAEKIGRALVQAAADSGPEGERPPSDR